MSFTAELTLTGLAVGLPIVGVFVWAIVSAIKKTT
jgi:hypothetical protein